MAVTPMLTTDPNTVKLWERQTFLEMYKKTVFGRMFSRGIIMRPEELERSQAGDETTIGYTTILTGIGVGEGTTLVGNEEALNNQSFQMKWNVFRHAVASSNKETIEQRRTYINFYETARKGLQGFHSSRLEASILNQLAGVNSTTITVDGTTYSGANRTFVQGLNAVNTPSSNRILRANGAASDEALTSADTFRLDLIDAAVEKLGLTYPNVEPLDNQEFDLFISYEQWTDLKRDTEGKIQWYPNVLALGSAAQKMLESSSVYATGEVYKYGRVNIIPTVRTPFGVNSSSSAAIPTVRRAILCGKKALAFGSAFSGILKDIQEGTNNGSTPLKYFDELKDFGYIKALEGRMIYGAKKIQFNNEDFGSLVISTYAAPHAF